MNYGYDSLGETKDRRLAKALEPLINALPPPTSGFGAYVDVDGLYPGVRIRRITHYPEEVIDKLIAAADEIYTQLRAEDRSQTKEEKPQ